MHFLFKGIQCLTPMVPERVRTLVRRWVSLRDYDISRRRAANPFLNMPEEIYANSPFHFGIIQDVSQYHKYYIAACREMKVSYKVLDIMADDWIREFQNSGCDAFLVWPTSSCTTLKQTFDYRLHILENDLGMCIYPTWRECWLTEHKPRLRDWMDAHAIPHPQTWVFHERTEAMDFAAEAPLPIVAKTATGGSASGIQVVQTRSELKRLIRKAFGKGLCPRGYDPRDRQRAFVFLQEYLPEVEEWRMVRIGDSFFGYRKEKGPTGLHSASHTWSWIDPGTELLDLLKDVTEAGQFTSMDVDIFRTREGRLLVNECQTVFGCSTPAIQMKVDGVEGRYLWKNGGWHFEPGSFCANHMCNLRLAYLLRKSKKTTL